MSKRRLSRRRVDSSRSVAVLNSKRLRRQFSWLPRYSELAGCAILTAAVFSIYWRGINAPFIFDDRASVLENSSILRLWPLLGDATEPGPLNPPDQFPTCGRPLVNLSLALNYHFGQLNPWGYHLFNVIVHLLSTLLLAAMMRRILQLDFFQQRFADSAGPIALLIALLWALHPLQTEAVQYITQRTELMASCFYLGAFYSSLRYWAGYSRRSRATWLVIASACSFAGVACKEIVVTAPVVVLLFERMFISGSFRQSLRRSWRLYLGLCSSWILLFVLNISGPRGDRRFSPGITGVRLVGNSG